MLIRYPGSKDQHLWFLMSYITSGSDDGLRLCEPFAGTAAVTFESLRKGWLTHYDICDADRGMVDLWHSVKDHPNELIRKINGYKPSATSFYHFKDNPGDTRLERGYRKLVTHQISYSGLGYKAGSPIGGRNQNGAYKVNCRWHPERLSKKILECHELLKSVPGTIRNVGWEKSLQQDCFFYLDPPYFKAGWQLYVEGTIDHQQLANTLRTKKNWVLSYDDCEEIRDMYTGCNIERVEVTSHLQVGKGRKKIMDVVITPK